MKRVLLVGASILILLVGGTFLLYLTDLASVTRNLQAGSQIAHTACGLVEYSVAGEGPAVLLVHGAGGGYSQVADIQVQLADSGFMAIAMSRFGYLRTPLPPDGTPAAQAEVHVCLLDALGLSQAAAIGISAGAPSALQFCAVHTDRCTALVLLVPAVAVPGREASETTPPSRFWSFVFDRVLRSDFLIWSLTRLRPELLVETILATPLEEFHKTSPAERKRALNIIREIFPVSRKLKGLQNDALVTTSALMTNLSQIAAPTLVISVRDDLYGTAAGATYAAKEIAGARLLLFTEGGHAWLGHDAEVRGVILAFLRESARVP